MENGSWRGAGCNMFLLSRFISKCIFIVACAKGFVFPFYFLKFMSSSVCFQKFFVQPTLFFLRGGSDIGFFVKN